MKLVGGCMCLVCSPQSSESITTKSLTCMSGGIRSIGIMLCVRVYMYSVRRISLLMIRQSVESRFLLNQPYSDKNEQYQSHSSSIPLHSSLQLSTYVLKKMNAFLWTCNHFKCVGCTNIYFNGISLCIITHCVLIALAVCILRSEKLL